MPIRQDAAVGGATGAVMGCSYDDAGNRLSAWNGNSVTHDLNGNMTAALGQTYSWNERNQLTASTGSVTAAFAYDSQGRRRARTVNGAMTNFLYDGQQPIQELTSGNVLSAELLSGGIDEIFSRSAGGVTQTFIVDALGSTLRLTDSAGAKDTDYTYEAYGKAANDNASNTNTFQYTGRENDGTQLQFNRARYYDPRLARFISEDPIGLAGGYNLFGYVDWNPVSYTDPTGEIPLLGTLIGAGVEIGMQAYRNYRNGCDVLDPGNYDWWDVGISAAVGAVAPGWLSVGKTSWTSGHAISTLSDQLSRARTANRVAKIEGRISDHRGQIGDALSTQAGFQGAKAIINSANGGKDCSCP
jgi:RHS repeat-associated protein